MDPQAPREPRDRTPDRALLALAGALIVAASTRVALPLVTFVVAIGLLALPMSSVIAWLSRFDPPPPGDDGDGAFVDEVDLPAVEGAAMPGEVVPLVYEPAEPLPRPVRPLAPGEPRLRRMST